MSESSLIPFYLFDYFPRLSAFVSRQVEICVTMTFFFLFHLTSLFYLVYFSLYIIHNLQSHIWFRVLRRSFSIFLSLPVYTYFFDSVCLSLFINFYVTSAILSTTLSALNVLITSPLYVPLNA